MARPGFLWMYRRIGPMPALLFGSFALAVLGYLFHDLRVNPQADTQMITNAFQLLQSVREGTLGDFLLTVRKYPLFPALIFTFAYGLFFVVLLGTGIASSTADLERFIFLDAAPLNLIGRTICLLAAIGTLVVLVRIARLLKMPRPITAALLLAASPLFLVFAAALRPHILVTFWTVLALYGSLLLRERRSIPRMILAFGSALAAFCTLQNGLLALIFPLWAFFTPLLPQEERRGEGDVPEEKCVKLPGGKTFWKRLVDRTFILAIFFFLIGSAMIGYPFLWNIVLGKSLSLGFDLGHNFIPDQPKWTGEGLIVIAKTFFSGELILTIFAALGLYGVVRRKENLGGAALPVTLYTVLYLLLFGLYSGPAPRFFIAVLPFFALIGGSVLAKAPRSVFIIFYIVALLIHAKFFLLTTRRNTYQQTRTYIENETEGAIATDIPHYLLGIPPTRGSIASPKMARETFYLTLDHDLPGARPMLPLNQSEHADVVAVYASTRFTPPSGWTLCKSIVASPTSNETMFLWTEAVENGLFYVWEAKTLGPNILIFCKS